MYRFASRELFRRVKRNATAYYSNFVCHNYILRCPGYFNLVAVVAEMAPRHTAE
jgi:hypothetical protein